MDLLTTLARGLCLDFDFSDRTFSRSGRNLEAVYCSNFRSGGLGPRATSGRQGDGRRGTSGCPAGQDARVTLGSALRVSGAQCGRLNLDTIAPQLLQLVKLAGMIEKDVDHQVDVVEEDPLGILISFHVEGREGQVTLE